MTQKNITILSMCAVVLGAVLVNGERFEPNQIKWEHELAQTVAKDANSKTLLGTKPNLQDRLLFEVFEGKYEAKLDQGQIQKITLLQNQSPIEIKTDSFMNDYAHLLKNFDNYSVSQVDSRNEAVQLKDKSGAGIAVLKIQRDDQGRVLNIEIQ
jgi:hypothetical protein